VPDYREISAENAAKGLEDRVCTEGDVGPGEVRVTMAEDDGEADGGDNTCSENTKWVSIWNRDQKVAEHTRDRWKK
jgi:hypothetical protein